MFTVIISLLIGVILGRLVKAPVLKANDLAFTFLSTLFVFIMGISLGLSRSTFSSVGGILLNSILIATIASLGSIIFTRLLGRLVVTK